MSTILQNPTWHDGCLEMRSICFCEWHSLRLLHANPRCSVVVLVGVGPLRFLAAITALEMSCAARHCLQRCVRMHVCVCVCVRKPPNLWFMICQEYTYTFLYHFPSSVRATPRRGRRIAKMHFRRLTTWLTLAFTVVARLWVFCSHLR